MFGHFFCFFCWANVSSGCAYCLKIAILKWKSGRETERQKDRKKENALVLYINVSMWLNNA